MNIRLKEAENEGNDIDVAFEILRTFYSDDLRDWRICIAEFLELQKQQITYRLKLDLDFESKPARYYIKADALLMNADIVGLYNHLRGDNKKAISIQFANQVKSEFLQSVAHFPEKWEWIYNPPAMPSINKWSIGREMRNDFHSYYGSYAEITYLIAITESISFEKANDKNLMEYLSVGEYLIRKRAVEGVE
jgi:hypothetical protein